MSVKKEIKCDRCMKSRPIISEKGLHCICTLPTKQAIQCLTGVCDHSVMHPHQKLFDFINEMEADERETINRVFR